MKKIDIKVKKNDKGEFLEGPFFVKELNFDEVIDIQDKISNQESDDSNERLIQSCLIYENGRNVFKPKQVNVIKNRINGVDFMAVLVVSNKLNDFSKISDLVEEYSKN